jgi:hypothetical protein
MSRMDQYAVAVEIDGKDEGIWDKQSGGGVDSEETKYKPGGMAKEVSLGGSTNIENVTVSRLYVLDRDHLRVKAWMSRVGRATVKVSKQPLDVDGNVFGDPIVYTGKLKRCTPPEVDSESSDAGLVEIEVSTSGTVA